MRHTKERKKERKKEREKGREGGRKEGRKAQIQEKNQSMETVPEEAETLDLLDKGFI